MNLLQYITFYIFFTVHYILYILVLKTKNINCSDYAQLILTYKSKCKNLQYSVYVDYTSATQWTNHT